MILETEFPFTLPRGYVDPEGTLHREGVMRLATAFRRDRSAEGSARAGQPRLSGTHPALAGHHQARSLSHVNPKVMEGLFTADFAFLQEFYRHINETGSARTTVACPHCETEFETEFQVELTGAGE